MSYQDDRLNQIQAEMNHLTNMRRQLRYREKSLDAQMLNMKQPNQFQYNNVKQLKKDMGTFLPEYMVPANVGGINEVSWPFFFQQNFDLTSILPALSVNSIVRASFQVDQEAAFLLMSIGRSHDTDASNQSATVATPLQVDLLDKQSTRRFNSGPIPLQTIGSNSNPSVLPTPMFIYPNAFFESIVSGIPPATAPQNWSTVTNGSGLLQLTFFGYRIRIEDSNKILSTIFG